MRYFNLLCCAGLVILAGINLPGAQAAEISGELKRWHPVTLTFAGPNASETDAANPFLNYRLNVVFTQGQRRVVVPGYFAADGNAAESSAVSGNKWRAHFLPDTEGSWRYRASFRTGEGVAVEDANTAGKPVAFDGESGTFNIKASDKKGVDFRGRGILRHESGRYLTFSGGGKPFLKGGTNSPENLLAFADFDDTPAKHRYEPHAADWKAGDPTWKGGKGKNLIGGLNYLSSKGVNSAYFLTMNVGGDGKDVWPWVSATTRDRYDCSKLDQWNMVFSHMDKVGIQLHVVLQEHENDQLLDGGDLGLERKLYHRELIARFAAHNALAWNLGEENTNTPEQRKAFAEHLKALDPYQHPIVIHNQNKNYGPEMLEPLLGFTQLNGPSLQVAHIENTHAETLNWLKRSADAKHSWYVCLDEIGPGQTGVMPDADDPTRDKVRRFGMWGNLMAGGSGCEWYFGYQYPHNDLKLEDWRSRDNLWDQTRYALDFFQQHLPFADMASYDDLTPAKDDYCFANPGKIYAVYQPAGSSTQLDLGNNGGNFNVRWYNPRRGGELQMGAVKQVSGSGKQDLGTPPAEPEQDWVILVTNIR